MLEIEKLAQLIASKHELLINLNTSIPNLFRLAQHLVENDVVRVVRCKDCKHYDCGNGHRPWCNHLNGLDEMHDEDFCSYGERRTPND